MSTRANVILKESYSYRAKNGKTVNRSTELIFYRHSDGYPEGVLPSITILTGWISAGKISRDLSQSAGWLIIIGAIEYGNIPGYKYDEEDPSYPDLNTITPPKNWKSGSYEITTQIHGDIEYLYTVFLNDLTIKIEHVSYPDGVQTFEEITTYQTDHKKQIQ